MIGTGDFNGDGKQDVFIDSSVFASGLSFNRVSLVLGNGDGTFQIGTQVSAVANDLCCESIAAAEDVNADGKPDLIFLLPGYQEGNAVGVNLGDGDGSFQPGLLTATGNVLPESLSVADFNADHRLDLAIGGNAGLSVVRGDGDGRFQAPAQYAVGAHAQAVSDFNGDGRLDIAGVSTGYGVIGVNIAFANGDGTFGYPTFVALIPSANTSTAAIAVADFNRDNNADFVLASAFDQAANSGTIAIFLGDGSGNFSEHDITVGSYITAFAAGDMNGDGIQLSANQ